LDHLHVNLSKHYVSAPVTMPIIGQKGDNPHCRV
jgi:hypothetical protein